jgi:uncharacterized membrane protein
MWNIGVRTPRSVLVTVLVALVVVIGALAVVVALRPGPDAPATAAPAITTPRSLPACGKAPCRTLKSLNIHGTTVALLDDGQGGSGLVAVGADASTLEEVTVTALGAKLGPDSLTCLDGSTAACLVQGGQSTGTVIAELLTSDGDSWRTSERQFLSDASYIGLDDVTGDNVPEVVLVRHECPDSTSGTPRCAAAPVLAEIFDLAGDTLGCTRKYTSPSQLHGWPVIRLSKSDIRACPAE